MRVDTIIFDGDNPFEHFAKCTELTVILGEDAVMLSGKIGSINLVASFNSIVNKVEDLENRSSYTVPLDLLLPIFRMDSKTLRNELVITTLDDKATISYNGIAVDTNIYSPNGLTMQQIKDIDWTSPSFAIKPFIDLITAFGTSKENVIGVCDDKLIISDNNKSMIYTGTEDYGKRCAVSDSFIRLARSLKAKTISLQQPVVATTEGGLFIVDSLYKFTSEDPILTYAYASRLKTTNQFQLRLGKFSKQFSIAAGSAKLSAKLHLLNPHIMLTSEQGESIRIPLNNDEVKMLGDVDFFSLDFSQEVSISNAGLLKSLSSFKEVNVKVMPDFVIARLDKDYKLIFTIMNE